MDKTALSDSYSKRPQRFQNIGKKQWSDWVWQQQHSIKILSQFKKIFPDFPETEVKLIEKWQENGFRFSITPYVLGVIAKDSQGNPIKKDPVWKQVFPTYEKFTNTQKNRRRDEYSPNEENWESAEEMISPIAQHKYDNRVIIYTADTCLGYCNYCFRSLQSESATEKHGGILYWEKTLKALQKLPKVEEIILSGGDPLIFDNQKIGKMLKDIRSISSIKAIRIHTRAWTHNPYRIDREFCQLLKQYQVTEIGVHIVHPQEITKEFQEAVERIRQSSAKTLLLTDTPLIKGINDNTNVLHKLFMSLYTLGIKPYYLSHNMPNIPLAQQQRTSVKKGLHIYNTLKRHISNPAMPEYIICHKSGKKTVPEDPNGTSEFHYGKKNGHPVIHFKNWKGHWEMYIDAPE